MTEVLDEWPEPATDGAAPDAPGLFAAPSVGSIDVDPVLTINGLTLTGHLGLSTTRLILDGFSVEWGRADVLEQADPATARVELFYFDPAGAETLSRIGHVLTLGWEGTLPGEATTSGTFFKGRVTDIILRPKSIRNADGTTTRGAVAEISATSVLTDLANIIPTVDWPEETMGARRARIETAAAGVLTSVNIRTYWETPFTPAVLADDQVSILEHLVNLYDSCGADRMTYSPDTDTTQPLLRRDYATERGVAGLWWNIAGDGTARAGQGIYARPLTLVPPGGTSGSPALPHVLDSAAVGYEEGLRRGPGHGITRVHMTHTDTGVAGDPDRTTVTMIAGALESAIGVRSVKYKSIVGWNAYADQAANDLAELVVQEGTRWSLDPIFWRPDMQGGFETSDQVLWLLKGAEVKDLVFLQRSFLPEFGVRPVLGVCGGVIGYRDEGWEFEINLAPLTPWEVPQHAISWEEIDDGTPGYEVRWYDTDHSRGMHESLTYEDLGHVARGLAVDSIPRLNHLGHDVTAYTPVYGLAYLEVGQPARDTRAVLQEVVETIEEALGNAGIPPADLPALIAAGWFTDTGWVTVTPTGSFASHENFAVRRIGKRVQLRGGVTNAALTASNTFTVATLPVGYRPPSNSIRGVPGMSSATMQGRASITTAGNVVIDTAAAVSTFYSLAGFSWLVD